MHIHFIASRTITRAWYFLSSHAATFFLLFFPQISHRNDRQKSLSTFISLGRVKRSVLFFSEWRIITWRTSLSQWTWSGGDQCTATGTMAGERYYRSNSAEFFFAFNRFRTDDCVSCNELRGHIAATFVRIFTMAIRSLDRFAQYDTLVVYRYFMCVIKFVEPTDWRAVLKTSAFCRTDNTLLYLLIKIITPN